MSVEEKPEGPDGFPFALVDDKTGEIVAWFSDREAATGVETWTVLFDMMGREIDRLRRMLENLGVDPGGEGWEKVDGEKG